jgi:PadR family transcriptional regulator PadR
LTQPKSDLLQGTLDMLILKALGPLHAYGIIQRIRQLSDELFEIEQGSLYPARSNSAAGSVPSGE